ncbi:reverse transcriptase family protein [Liquorilactobacillus sp.]|uniref:reverse transcriptase family protein n=1 Tax=Liquorilactobacillus sp. TaxID=2767923 RepID=UPI0039E86A7E
MDFSKSPLYKVQSKKKLSYLLKVPLKELKNTDQNFKAENFESGERVFTKALPKLKRVLKIVVVYLEKIGVPNFLYGGIKGKNTLNNVEQHIANGFVLKTDIRHFFPSTRYADVYNFFYSKLDMSRDCATIMANITTFKISKNSRSLPQGYSTSPLLSFFSYVNLFLELDDYARHHNMIMTTYYDDITLSSSESISKAHLRMVEHIIRKYDFEPHPNKTKLLNVKSTNKRVKITGFLVHKQEIKIPKSKFKKLYDTNKEVFELLHDLDNATTKEIKRVRNSLVGCISSVAEVNTGYDLSGYIQKVCELNIILGKRN